MDRLPLVVPSERSQPCAQTGFAGLAELHLVVRLADGRTGQHALALELGCRFGLVVHQHRVGGEHAPALGEAVGRDPLPPPRQPEGASNVCKGFCDLEVAAARNIFY